MQKETDDLVLFYGNNSVFSNHYPTAVTIQGTTFGSSEQAFMFLKARFFKDHVSANSISLCSNPITAKKIGREIVGYDDEKWASVREQAMKIVNVAKFNQNYVSYLTLISTGCKILVEASPIDRIWGIGQGILTEEALDPSKWRGQNLMGKVLMDIREEFSRFNG
jgi:hypothetical protein